MLWLRPSPAPVVPPGACVSRQRPRGDIGGHKGPEEWIRGAAELRSRRRERASTSRSRNRRPAGAQIVMRVTKVGSEEW